MTSTDRATRTPGPWLTPQEFYRANPAHRGRGLRSEMGYQVAIAYGRTDDERDSNAEFIVTACNAHDALHYALCLIAAGRRLSAGGAQGLLAALELGLAAAEAE